MSVTMSRAKGVTVFTVTSDPDSRLPPLCQILKTLCCSPVCCSVSRQLKKVQRTSVVDLGVMQIVIGLLHISLGHILYLSDSGALYLFETLGFPYWLGALFILFGSVCLLSDKYPSPCLVILSVILNLAGGPFALAAVGLYGVNVSDLRLRYRCSGWKVWSYQPTTPSPPELELCIESKALLHGILIGISIVLIILSVLEFCVAISSANLGVVALKSSDKEPNKTPDDPEATAG